VAIEVGRNSEENTMVCTGKPASFKKKLAKRIKISTTAIDKNIAALKMKGLLKRVGPAKGGHWEIRSALSMKHGV